MPHPTPYEIYCARVASGSLEADAAQAAAARRMDALAEALSRWRPGGFLGLGARPAPMGVYLWGPVGRGKSMLMDLFFAAAPIERKRRTHFHEFMVEQHAFLKEARAGRSDGQEEIIAAAAKVVARGARLLCFDELQVTDIADAMILGRLFERLFADDVVVVATSNRHPRDLYKNGLNRQLFVPFIDLLLRHVEPVELEAERDYRLERLLARPVYFSPLGPHADQEMDRAWRELTVGADPKPQTLSVQGRALTVRCAAAGCARFSFADLCERPLGAADYLEIAERFHTVLIEGIPKLTPDRREEAARFRNLIDALYETKTKLVCSAASEPATLYPDGAQSFEFERTASRLMEMRSAVYLALERRDREWMREVTDT